MEKNIESLIALARSGDESAFAEIVSLYRPLLESMSKAYKKKCVNEIYSEEDFLQEATMALYSAVNSYKDGNNVTFGLYSKICVKNRLVSFLRSAGRKNVRTSNAKQNQSDPLSRLVDSEGWTETESKIRSCLSKFEWSVFALYIQKKSYAEMADELGVSEKSVDNAIYRLKKKLKQFI